MNTEALLKLLEKKYPSSIHEGFARLSLWPSGSGEIWHAEMCAFTFKNLQELYEHLSEDSCEIGGNNA